MLSYELASVPRDQVWSMHLASWSDRVGRRLKQCTAAVRDDCGNVYFLRGVPTVSYRTVSCRVRDVAEADVFADIKDMDEFDTEAKRLGHLQLVACRPPPRLCVSPSEWLFLGLRQANLKWLQSSQALGQLTGPYKVLRKRRSGMAAARPVAIAHWPTAGFRASCPGTPCS